MILFGYRSLESADVQERLVVAQHILRVVHGQSHRYPACDSRITSRTALSSGIRFAIP